MYLNVGFVFYNVCLYDFNLKLCYGESVYCRYEKIFSIFEMNKVKLK